MKIFEVTINLPKTLLSHELYVNLNKRILNSIAPPYYSYLNDTVNDNIGTYNQLLSSINTQYILDTYFHVAVKDFSLSDELSASGYEEVSNLYITGVLSIKYIRYTYWNTRRQK